MTRQSEIAWAAGFFDGEGNTSLSGGNGKDRKYLYIKFANTDISLMRRFVNAVGEGKVSKPRLQKSNHFGKKPLFWIQIGGSKAARVLEVLWPYLGRTKKMQAYHVSKKAKGVEYALPPV